MLPTFLIRLLFLAITGLGITACNTCDDPSGPGPTEGLPDLMFTSYIRDVAPRLYTAKADGSGQRPWSTTSGYLTQTGLLMSSPRAGKIAFITNAEDSGPSSLVVADINGANAVVLESDAEFNDVLYAVLSPDGKSVVVTQRDEGPSSNVVVYDVATKAKKQIANDIQSESQVFFTPHSNEIAYYTMDNRIIMMNLDGSNKRTLVNDAYSNADYSCFLDFSPSGDRMVYMRHKQDQDETELAILTLATGTVTTFKTSATEIFGYPVWSPAGESISYVRGSNRGDRSVLAIDDARGNGTERVLHDLANNHVRYPQWSGDGKYVSATVNVGEDPDDGVQTVRVYNAATSTATLIGNDLIIAFWVR